MSNERNVRQIMICPENILQSDLSREMFIILHVRFFKIILQNKYIELAQSLFVHTTLWKNLNEPLGQPNSIITYPQQHQICSSRQPYLEDRIVRTIDI